MNENMLRQFKQKKIAAGFLCFLLFMWLCTLISKSIYASGLPQVTVSSIEKKSIEHNVEAEGIIKQGSDTAIHTLSGMRVEKIYVREGDTVEEGSLLFNLDKEDLEEIIENKKLEAAKLTYQIADLKQNRKLQKEEWQREQERSKEDYLNAEGKGNRELDRAEEVLNKAEKRLDEHKNNPADITSGEDRQKAFDEYNKWLEQQKDPADTVSGNVVEKPDFSGEDSEKRAWKSSKEALEDGVEDARRQKEDAVTERQDALTQAQRALEDALMEIQADSTLEIYELQLKQLDRDIEKYKEIYEANAQVTSEGNGTVTKINLTAGERTPDGAAVVCADTDVSYQFEAAFTKEQKKYINQGDKITLQTAGWKKELQIDYLKEDENSPGSYRGIVYLPEGEGSIGMSGTLTKKEVSESFESCIPIEALHSDNNGTRYFVYILAEKEGILGRELYAEERTVKVLDKNDRYAAIENGGVDKKELIIIGANKPIENNRIVRMRDH